MATALAQFLHPFLARLDVWLDAHVVRTMYDVVVTIIRWRHSTLSLLLSELGGHRMPPGQAPAGAKRIGTLIRSDRWRSEWIDPFLWNEANQRIQENTASFVVWLLSTCCHRTGKRCQLALAPLYRLRAALMLRKLPSGVSAPCKIFGMTHVAPPID